MPEINRTPQPLFDSQAVVTSAGFPTPYFIRWCQERMDAIQGSVTPEQVTEIITEFLAAHPLIAGTGIALTPSGDLSDGVTITLKDTAVAPGTYGDATHVAQITVDQQGRLTAVAQVAISGGGGSGSYTKIAQVITSAAQSTISFTAIPATFRSLRLVFNGRMSSAIASGELRMQFNGDTGNNYDWIVENRFGTANGNGVAFIRCGDPLGTSSPANYPQAALIDIPDYVNTVFYKSVQARDEVITSLTAAGMFGLQYGGWWRNLAVINRIDLLLNSGNFINGSVASLYGIS